MSAIIGWLAAALGLVLGVLGYTIGRRKPQAPAIGSVANDPEVREHAEKTENEQREDNAAALKAADSYGQSLFDTIIDLQERARKRRP